MKGAMYKRNYGGTVTSPDKEFVLSDEQRILLLWLNHTTRNRHKIHQNIICVSEQRRTVLERILKSNKYMESDREWLNSISNEMVTNKIQWNHVMDYYIDNLSDAE